MTVDEFRIFCKQRGDNFSRLERELGFSNGYISKLSNMSEMRGDRLTKIAERFGVPVQMFTEANCEPTKYMSMDENDMITEVRLKPYLKNLLFAGGRVDEVQVEAITYALNAIAEAQKKKKGKNGNNENTERDVQGTGI